MDFQILLSPAKDFQGILFWHCLSILPLYVYDYGKLTKGALWSHLPPTTDQMGKLSVACKDLRKALVMAPRSILKRPLKWLIMALNPIQTKINRLQTTDVKTYDLTYEYYMYIRVVISAGVYEFSLNLLVVFNILKHIW